MTQISILVILLQVWTLTPCTRGFQISVYSITGKNNCTLMVWSTTTCNNCNLKIIETRDKYDWRDKKNWTGCCVITSTGVAEAHQPGKHQTRAGSKQTIQLVEVWSRHDVTVVIQKLFQLPMLAKLASHLFCTRMQYMSDLHFKYLPTCISVSLYHERRCARPYCRFLKKVRPAGRKK